MIIWCLKNQISLLWFHWFSVFKNRHTVLHCTPSLPDNCIMSHFMIIISCCASLEHLMKYFMFRTEDKSHKIARMLRIIHNLLSDDVIVLSCYVRYSIDVSWDGSQLNSQSCQTRREYKSHFTEGERTWTNKDIGLKKKVGCCLVSQLKMEQWSIF